MNFPTIDSIIGRQRCRQWIPLITQQLRLRHLYQITAYNIASEKSGSFYFTLHLTTLSAPFYTSEKINSPNPKWAELELTNSTPLSVSGIVLRIWQNQEDKEMDTVISTWGINFSGLVYIGNKLSEIQPTYFKENSVILHLRGGFFTSHKTLRTDLPKPLPFIDHLNIVSTEEDTKISKNTGCSIATIDIKSSYNVGKLQKLHSLQISMKNKALDAQILREKIEGQCGIYENAVESPTTPVAAPAMSSSPPVRYAPQLLTMNSLNKMLQEKPTKFQKKEIMKVKKEIELAKFRTKLLTKERNQKTQQIRQLKQKYTQLYEQNEEKESRLMDNYRTLSKDVEKLREWRKEQIQQRDDLHHYTSQLHHRRRQLVSQLLYIYPIKQIESNKFCINGVYLPDSDLLSDCSDTGLSVALGYVAHILTMCASFLQVPLRYPVVHLGSRSHIIDHISPALTNDKDREFPLYTKGKDRMQFNYAVYLLNKNIAQLRLLCGLQTLDLRATLPNLLSFLQGKDHRDIGPALTNKLEILSQKLRQEELLRNSKDISDGKSKPEENGDCDPKNKIRKNSPSYMGGHSLSSSPNLPDPILDQLRHQCQLERTYTPVHKPSKKVKPKSDQGGPGLSEILAIPEAYLNRQISSSVFKTYMCSSSSRLSTSTENTDLVPQTRSSSKSSEKSNITAIKADLKASDKPCDIKVARHSKFVPSAPSNEVIEQGTDLLDPDLNMKTESGMEKIEVYMEQPSIVLRNNTQSVDISAKQKRKSRSVGSYTEEDKSQDLRTGAELGSDPVINTSADGNAGNSLDLMGLPASVGDRQTEFLQKWLDSGPALVCSEENLYPEEILGTVASENGENQLTLRTDALLSTTSFNLVKPKF